MGYDLRKLLALPPADRVRLAEQLMASLPAAPDDASDVLLDWQRAELERRLAEYPEDDSPGLPVAEVMDQLRREIWLGR